MHIHTGVGHTDSESAQHFHLENLTRFSGAPVGVRTSGDRILSPTLHQQNTPRHPIVDGGVVVVGMMVVAVLLKETESSICSQGGQTSFLSDATNCFSAPIANFT